LSETLIEIIPFIHGSALTPFEIIIILLLLTIPSNELGKAVLFLLGVTTTRILQGIIFSLILNPGASAESTNGKGHVKSMLLLVLGLLLLNKTLKIFKKEPDPEDDPPKWIATINSATTA